MLWVWWCFLNQRKMKVAIRGTRVNNLLTCFKDTDVTYTNRIEICCLKARLMARWHIRKKNFMLITDFIWNHPWTLISLVSNNAGIARCRALQQGANLWHGHCWVFGCWWKTNNLWRRKIFLCTGSFSEVAFCSAQNLFMDKNLWYTKWFSSQVGSICCRNDFGAYAWERGAISGWHKHTGNDTCTDTYFNKGIPATALVTWSLSLCRYLLQSQKGKGSLPLLLLRLQPCLH